MSKMALLLKAQARLHLTELLQQQTADVSMIAGAPRTDEELWAWVSDYLNIQIPRERVCSGHVAPFEAFADAYFARAPIDVWLASRGFGGKTVMLATLALTEAITLGATVTLLGGSGEQSRRVHEYQEGTEPSLKTSLWNAARAPRKLIDGSLSAWRTKLRNGGRITALTASQKSARGPHPSRLRMDEIDEMDLTIFDAALGQPMGTAGVPAHVVASSTHQNPDGTMTEVLKRADENGWPVKEWCYRESLAGGWLSQQEVDRKRAVVTRLMWETEYELQEPSAEGLAFDRAAVDRMFDPALGEVMGDPGQLHVFEPPPWEEHTAWPADPEWFAELGPDERRRARGSRRWRMRHLKADQHAELTGVLKRRKELRRESPARYAAGADWGKTRDRTEVVVLRTDVRPYRLVAYVNQRRRPYPEMFGTFNELVARFWAVSAHDATGGLGTAAEDYMEFDTIDVKMLGEERRELFNDWIVGVEADRVRSPRIAHVHGAHRYCRHDDLYGRGHPPDPVVAAAMAYHAARLPGILV